MGPPLRVLIIEDSQDDADLLVRELRRGGFDLTFHRVDTRAAMMETLDARGWDIIIADYMMPNFTGLDALKLMQEKEFDLPFIILSGSIGEDTAVEAMKAGVHDYIMKGNLTRLLPAINREVKEAAVRRARTQAETTAQYLAYYDPVVNLPNRAKLRDSLQETINTGQPIPFALLIADLNRYWEINSTLGHNNGDTLLRQVGLRMKEVLQKSHMLASLGGDEFAVLLLNADADYAARIAENILQALEAPFEIAGFTLEVDACIGIALFPDHGTSPDLLMQHADVATDIAKKTGSNFAIYAVEHDPYSPQRLKLMGELRHAIGNNQLSLHYQPKIDFQTGCTVGVEALMRWHHPQHGAIPPDDFIAMTERTGLIKALTLWALNAALEQCHAWDQMGLKIPVAVNVSSRNLQDPNFVGHIDKLLKIWKIGHECLELEITESTLMTDPVNAMNSLSQLSNMGIHLTIDDFGTGYSSLSYLQKLPINTIKIDKSFVIDMTKNLDSAVIVLSTIELAHHLGLKVVAEGVEDRQTWDKLAGFGCDLAQGYYVSYPMPANNFLDWLDKSVWCLTPKQVVNQS
jgi:diguanylate cyclase (GGDEF)-like protein